MEDVFNAVLNWLSVPAWASPTSQWSTDGLQNSPSGGLVRWALDCKGIPCSPFPQHGSTSLFLLS